MIFIYCTKWHPRLKVIRHKSIGVALIDKKQFLDFKEYYSSVNGKNSAAYETRKCLRRGYSFLEIDPYQYQRDIYLINTSAKIRQGREMDEWYRKEKPDFIRCDSVKYYGVAAPNGDIVAYCMIDYLEPVAILSKLLGHRDHLKQGIMYLMVVEFIKKMFSRKDIQYVMYDTWFGAPEGLKRFKKKLGFKPYHVKWTIV